MPTEVYLVKVGMSMTEGVVEEWYIPDGGQVAVGELLYRLETEKVNLDVDAEAAGTVKHLVAEGVTMEPGDVVGYIFAAGEAIPDDLGGAGASGASAEVAAPAAAAQPVAAASPAPMRQAGERIFSSPAARRLARELNVDIESLGGSGPGGRIVEADVQLAADSGAAHAGVHAGGEASPSSPMARKLARELGVDLSSVRGTGPGGRITREDVENTANNPTSVVAAIAAPLGAPAASSTVPIRGMRKTIAARMHESLQTMAQLTMDMDVVMDDAIKLRNQLVSEWADQGIKPTYNDLVIRAASKALADHPLMNASFGDKEMTLHGHISVGMAVALEEGLIVPVVQNSNLLDMRSLAIESSRLALAAREGKLGVQDMQGGTFTVSALGMFGVDSFTPIINSPQAGILGVNRIRDDVAWDGDRPVKRQVMRLSLTWDHRVLDGAPAAEFLGSVRDYLESPFRLLI